MAFTENQKYSIIDFDKHIRSSGPGIQERASAWKTTIGLHAVDGLQTSDYLKDTAVKHIKDDISIDDARKLIKSYHIANKAVKDEETKEADEVSANTVKVLSENTFTFSQTGLTTIRRKLFDGYSNLPARYATTISPRRSGYSTETLSYMSMPKTCS